MKHPVWHFEIVRDTNAPFELVRKCLLDGQNYHRWHPRHCSETPEIVEDSRDSRRFEILCRKKGFGVTEEAWYRVEPVEPTDVVGGRLLLIYRNRFKGWLVLIMMGWWRMRSERIWDRLIAFLGTDEG